MNSATDTIVAIATAPGESGIAVIRISGPLSLNIANGIFRRRGVEPLMAKGGTFHHGYIVSGAGEHEKLDEVILLIFNKPKSYTREDVVEIHTHGGRICAQRILRVVLAAGARMAEPGEFTKRAFLNGRIDLLQAEAVADLISARSDKAATSAIEQLAGRLTCYITSIYESCIYILSSVEGSLDFPEDEVPAPVEREIGSGLDSVSSEIKQLLATWDEGRFLRDGALVVICGLPNAGKSTVFNNLLKVERAIVSEKPGTTRDFIEEPMTLDGIPIRLVDTAGLRSSDCAIETEGVKRARELMSRADLFLYIVDISLPQSKEDLAELTSLPSDKVLVILNKADLKHKVASTDFPGFACIACSAVSSADQEKLREAILHKLRPGEGSSGAHISERHRILLISAQSEIEKAQSLLAAPPSVLEQHEYAENADLSLIAIHIRSALDSLGKITGKIYCNDLLDNIFRRFCIGK